jgi:hypothetical protein
VQGKSTDSKHIQSKKKQRVLLIEQYIDIIQTVVDRKSRMIVMIQSRVVKYNTAAETNKWYHPALQKMK